MFYDGNMYHYIEIVEQDSSNKYHVLYRHNDLRTNHSCGKLISNIISFNLGV